MLRPLGHRQKQDALAVVAKRPTMAVILLRALHSLPRKCLNAFGEGAMCYVRTLALERLLAHVARAGEAMGRPGAIPRSDGHITNAR